MAGKNALQILIATAFILACIGAVFWKISDIRANPEIALLLPEHGAQWIRTPPRDGLRLHWDENITAEYRTDFTILEVPEKAILYVRPFRYAEIYLDGALIGRTSSDLAQWKRRYEFDLAQSPHFTPGTHELLLSVSNTTGPAAILVHSDALGIVSNEEWASRDYGRDEWASAILADAPMSNPIGEQLTRSDEALWGLWRIFVPLFVFVMCWTIYVARMKSRPRWLQRITPTASGIRWFLLFAWLILAANNITKLPYGFGFDVPQHMEYNEFLIRKWSVPFATDGWQMFQSPLYYLLSAPLYVLSTKLLSVARAPEALRIIPLLCGALQIELCYRATRMVFPTRQDLQSLGTVVGGLLPINVYQSQYIGNEPLAAVFSSCAIVLALGMLRSPNAYWSVKTFAFMGALIGLGLLTKVSNVLICGPLVLLTLYVGLRRVNTNTARIRDIFASLATMFGVAFLVCGWYYIRNWVNLGAPFVGGWDPSRGYIWWQEPGYRTVGQFLRFGQSLLYPFYSSVHGLWDGLYSTLWLDGYDGCAGIIERPFWNLDFLLSCTWLSVLPSTALIIGAVAALLAPARAIREGQLFSAICLVVYFLAIVMMMIHVPSYSTLKATYALGVLCCFAIVAAHGFDLLLKNAVARGVVFAGMTCWSVAVYAGYFVL